MPVRLQTLGVPLELLDATGEPYKLTNAKHLALLAYLALEPGTYARDWLTRFIWSSGEAGSMNDAVSSLRGIFGPEAFPPRTREINLDPQLVECDARELLVVATSEVSGDFNRVLELYRGPFLADFNAKGASSRFISWVERKRAEFERVFLDASQGELRLAAAAGEWRRIQETVEAILKRVSTWPEAAEWMTLAGTMRDQAAAPYNQPTRPVPAATATATTTAGSSPPHSEPAAVPSAPSQPAVATKSRIWQIIGGLVAALILVGVVVVLRSGEQEHRAPGSKQMTARAPDSPSLPCAPGGASAELIGEVFHYGVRVRPGRLFVKGWTLQNTGNCTWETSYRLHRVSGDEPRLSSIMMDVPLQRAIPPGDTAMLVVPMRAPVDPGKYEEVWELRDRGNKPVAIGTKKTLVAMVRVPLPHYPSCQPGEGTAALLEKKFPDGTVVRPGQAIRWSWVLRNNGECAWGENAALHYVSDTNGRMSRIDSASTTRSVEPGETYTFLAPLRAPTRPGPYVELWRLHAGNGAGIPVDGLSVVNVQLRVQAADVPVTAAPICAPGQAHLRFVDENWPDSSSVRPGQVFTKRWTVTNSGTCAWAPTYSLRYVSHTAGQLAQSRTAKPLGELVPPDAAYTFEVPMRAPAKPGFYREDWEFVDDRGNRIMIGTAPHLAALIVVAG
jgi:DNA-binding SARP family transcriptional activator